MDRSTSELNNKVCDLHQQEQLLIDLLHAARGLVTGGIRPPY